MRMLIVPNNNLISNILKPISHCNYNVETAENGFSAALMYIKSHDEQKPFNLICLQHEMAVMAGHDALIMIRNFERKIMKSTSFCNAYVFAANKNTHRLYQERGLIDLYTHISSKQLDASSMLNIIYKSKINIIYKPIL